MHYFVYFCLSDLLSAFLVLGDDLAEAVNGCLFDLTCHHLTLGVALFDILQLSLIFEEEPQVLERYVNIYIATILLMFLESDTTA